MRNVCWFVLLYFISSQVPCRCENRCQIHVKKERHHSREFLNYIRQCPVYVDKTLLAEYALRKWPGRFMMLVAPPRWGKSTLLSMLEFFFQPELDHTYRALPQNRTASYEFFAHGQLDNGVFIEPPLISQHSDLLHRYVARHPVIRLNFDNTTDWSDVGSYQEFLGRFENVVSKQVRDRHYAAMKTLCESKKDSAGRPVSSIANHHQCTNHAHPTNEFHLKRYVSAFADLLTAYYGKSPVILVDGYDKLFSDLYLRSNFTELRTRIVGFFTDFLDITYRNSKSLFTLLAGVLPIEISRGNWSYSAYHVVHHQHEDVYQYLGITEQEADSLFHHRGFDDEKIVKAKNFYGGYHVEWKPNVTVLNPFSVLRFVDTGIIGEYWSHERDYFFMLDRMRRNPNARKYLLDLLLDRDLPCPDRRNRASVSFEQLRSLNDPDSDNFTAVIRATGLLSILGYVTDDHDEGRVKIPNWGYRTALSLALFREKFRYDDLEHVSTSLIELLENRKRDAWIFAKQFAHTVPSTKLSNNDCNCHITNDGYRFVDYCVVRLCDVLRYTAAMHGYQYTVEINETDIFGSYVAIHGDTYGAIIELTVEVTPFLRRYTSMVGAPNQSLRNLFKNDLQSRDLFFLRMYPKVTTLRMMIIDVYNSEESRRYFIPQVNQYNQVY